VGLGATGLAAFNVCVVLAVQEADPAAVGVIVGCLPLVLDLVDPLLHARRPRFRLLAATAVVQDLEGSTSPTALAPSFGALASEAGFSLLAAPVIPRLGPVNVSLYACLAASALLGVGALAIDGRSAFPMPTPAEAGAIVYLGGVATVVAFVAWYASIERVGVAQTGIFAGLVSVGAFVTAIAIGTGSFHPLRAIGAFVVVGGIALALATDRSPLDEAGSARSRPPVHRASEGGSDGSRPDYSSGRRPPSRVGERLSMLDPC
jgi:drug/metabolite transporter (DMT)-like permease